MFKPRVGLNLYTASALAVGVIVPFAPLGQIAQTIELGHLLNANTLGMGTIVASVFGVVIWLIRDNRKQAVDVNAQFLNHMLGTLEKDQAIHATYAESIKQLATSVEANTAAMGPVIATMQEMSESVKNLSESVRQMVKDHHKDVEALVADYHKGNRS